MGWFDDDDDDDEEGDVNHKADGFTSFSSGISDRRLDSISHSILDDGKFKGSEHQMVDDDPLDAYMKSIQYASSVPPNTDQTFERDSTDAKDEKDSGSGRRLDLENEDEATSHWLENTEAFRQSNEDHDDEREQEDDDFLYSERSKHARQALRNIFHKAGGKSDAKDFNFQSNSEEPSPSSAGMSKLDDSKDNAAPIRKVFWQPQDTDQGRQWRRDHQVVYHHQDAKMFAHAGGVGERTIDPLFDLDELREILGPQVLATMHAAGYRKPTTVQAQTVPVALSGHDVLVTAATGQGKTLAYLWPALAHVLHQPPLASDETGPVALVLVPTRELAAQVHKQAKPLLDMVEATSKVIVGGQGRYVLQQELKKLGGVHLVVATPGRLLDVVSSTSSGSKKGGMRLDRVSIIVLDEADKMLHMGFEAQVTSILTQLRRDRQTLMVSATMSTRIEKVAAQWMQPSRVRIAVGRTGQASDFVDQQVMILPSEEAKRSFLIELLPTFAALGRILVFVATREGCERLAADLAQALPDVTLITLHGDKHQSDRNAALRAFSKGQVRVLIATDVAARGLDVPNVNTVVSFDVAKNFDSHVHRIGRAGRLSTNNDDTEQQVGTAYTLLTPKNADFAYVLRNAFEREGREVSPELSDLAQQSRRSGQSGTFSRPKNSKSGLGLERYDNRSNPNQGNLRESMVPDSAPLPKRGRWS